MTRGTDQDAKAVRRYRRLLSLFPRRYVDEAAGELCQVFEDEHRDARQRGHRGVAVLWLRVTLDTGISLLSTWSACLREKGKEPMTGWIRDIRAPFESVARRPGFAAAVTLTLGLGIGATTTILSVVDGVMIRPLPYDEASRLVTVGGTDPGREQASDDGLVELERLSMLSYQSLRARARSFEGLAGMEPVSVFLADEGEGPDEVRSARVASELFELLGVAPALGRTFLSEEHRADAGGAVLITYGGWQQRFGGDPDVVGRLAPRFYRPTTVVGVLPRDFMPPEAVFPDGERPELWVPLQPDHDRYRGQRPAVWVIGKLAQDVTIDRARVEVSDIAAELAAEFPDANLLPDGSHASMGVNALQDQTVGSTGGALGIFLGSAVLLLVLASMNAATLFLARLLDRTGELGMRTALGAGRWQIPRLLVSEAFQARVEDGPRPTIYVPHTQYGGGTLHAVVRTLLPVSVIAPDLRRAVARFNPIEPLRDMRSMGDRMGAARAKPALPIRTHRVVRDRSRPLGGGGSLQLAVALGGQAPARARASNALGADGDDVRRMVLGQGMAVTVWGLVVGTVGALACGRALAGFLYGVSPNDPLVLLAAGVALLLVTAVASVAPALRATTVDPVTVLKSE